MNEYLFIGKTLNEFVERFVEDPIKEDAKKELDLIMKDFMYKIYK